MDKQSFISMVYPQAIDNYKKFGILPSVTIAAAGLESGWGSSGLAKSGNNLFGIKGIGTAGSISMQTTEEINGIKEQTEAEFRKYNSWFESIFDYGLLLGTKDRYKGVREAKDFKTAAAALGASGYATSSTYGTDIYNTIVSNKLYEIDNAVTGSNYSANSLPLMNTGLGSSLLNPNLIQPPIMPIPDTGLLPKETVGIVAGILDFLGEILFKAAFLIPGVLLGLLGLWILVGAPTSPASFAKNIAKGEN